MDLSKYEPLLVVMDQARVPLEMRRAIIIKSLGPKLLEPLMDQSLDPGDMEKISEEIFEHLKTTKEYETYKNARREQNSKMIELLQEMASADEASWDELMKAELAATSKNDVIAVAQAKNIKINVQL